jgi:hypothetical protein
MHRQKYDYVWTKNKNQFPFQNITLSEKASIQIWMDSEHYITCRLKRSK